MSNLPTDSKREEWSQRKTEPLSDCSIPLSLPHVISSLSALSYSSILLLLSSFAFSSTGHFSSRSSFSFFPLTYNYPTAYVFRYFFLYFPICLEYLSTRTIPVAYINSVLQCAQEIYIEEIIKLVSILI